MLQVDILVEILDGFDVVVSEGQPSQQVHFLQYRDHSYRGFTIKTDTMPLASWWYVGLIVRLYGFPQNARAT